MLALPASDASAIASRILGPLSTALLPLVRGVRTDAITTHGSQPTRHVFYS
jgi:hypothetical protein